MAERAERFLSVVMELGGDLEFDMVAASRGGRGVPRAQMDMDAVQVPPVPCTRSCVGTRVESRRVPNEARSGLVSRTYPTDVNGDELYYSRDLNYDAP